MIDGVYGGLLFYYFVAGIHQALESHQYMLLTAPRQKKICVWKSLSFFARKD